ncbi:MAG TPA: zf-HC2 domain-containing protein [Ktedonosporobacter sp.]|nr:zf-HC2 domain-containing protein [Ktedonosporobacter sp.]
MRCLDAKLSLDARHDGDQSSFDQAALEEHLQQCPTCRAYEQRQQRLDSLLCARPSRVRPSISTDTIMLAVQQQRRITQQLEDLRQQQQSRIARMRSVGAACAAIGFFTLSCIPLLLLAMTIIQANLVVKALLLLNGVIDVFIILAQYTYAGLTLVTRDNWLLSGVAFAVVVMTGMWLRLMRHPREA